MSISASNSKSQEPFKFDMTKTIELVPPNHPRIKWIGTHLDTHSIPKELIKVIQEYAQRYLCGFERELGIAPEDFISFLQSDNVILSTFIHFSNKEKVNDSHLVMPPTKRIQYWSAFSAGIPFDWENPLHNRLAAINATLPPSLIHTNPFYRKYHLPSNTEMQSAHSILFSNGKLAKSADRKFKTGAIGRRDVRISLIPVYEEKGQLMFYGEPRDPFDEVAIIRFPIEVEPPQSTTPAEPSTPKVATPPVPQPSAPPQSTNPSPPGGPAE